MKLALFGPLSAPLSGVPGYVGRLRADLSARNVAHAFVDAPHPPPGAYPWRDFAWRDLRDPYDLAVYHMASHLSHAYVYPFVFHRSGVLVLHDLSLHPSRLAGYLDSHELLEYKAWDHDAGRREAAEARLGAYREEVRAAYPERGAWVAEIALAMGGGRLLRQYPLYELLVRASQMTLVHSASARARVEATCPDSRVRLVTLGVELPPALAQESARRDLALPAGLLLVCLSDRASGGRVPAALRAAKRLVGEGVDLRCLLAGSSGDGCDPMWDARRLGIAERASVVEDLPESGLLRYAAAADLCVDLRQPARDTPPASLLRLLGTGRAVVVMDPLYGNELPEGVMARVDPLDEAGLCRHLRELLRNPERRAELGRRGRDHVDSHHRLSHMVDDYLRCLDEARRLPTPPPVSLPEHLAGLKAAWPERMGELARRTGRPLDELRALSRRGVRIPSLLFDEELGGQSKTANRE